MLPRLLLLACFATGRAAAQVITTVAGTYPGDGGPATSAVLEDPWGVALDVEAGAVYIADRASHRVRRVQNGYVTTFAGVGGPVFGAYSGDNGPATSAALSMPRGAAWDSDSSSLYIADTGNHRLRRVSPLGIISTVAGNGTPAYWGDGGLASDAGLSSPCCVAVDPERGVLYIGDTENYRIRRVTSDGVISTFAGRGAADSSLESIPYCCLEGTWSSSCCTPAAQEALPNIAGIAVYPATGDVYVSATNVYRIGLSGSVTVVVPSDLDRA
jgi:DNA-binding beta-propeller fold protein YncE